MSELASLQRRIDLEGCNNFRDLGGYPTQDGRSVRWRRLFRSDALQHLSARGVTQVRDELGIGCVVDLRSTRELRYDGRGLLERESIDFHHLPLFDGDMAAGDRMSTELGLGDLYFLMVEFAGEKIAQVLTTLAEAQAPAVYHCAAGKDRTGVISALLLGLLGVPDEIIAADYAATQENLDAIIERLMATRGYDEVLQALPPDTLHAQPETMLTLLSRIRERFGSVRECVCTIGVSDASVTRLETFLLGE